MSREKMMEVDYPTRIDRQNNNYRIKEIIKHYNRLDATISKYTQEAIEKYSISKESNKFIIQLEFTPKGIDMKKKALETAKNT